MLSCQKASFFLPEDVHYLNCAYMSPQSRRVEAAGVLGLQRKRNPTAINPESFFDESDAVREAFAALTGIADPQRVAILPAASYGLSAAARNTSVEHGQNVVVLGEQFPSNYYTWSRRCREQEAELRVVAPPGEGPGRGQRWNEALIEAIDSATAAVALPAAHWSDGTLFDLAAVRDRSRDAGAAMVIDGTQTVGALPFDVGQVLPDALICAGYKTLMGPYSLGLGYFGPLYDEGVPLEENWAPRAGSDDFARLVDYQESYRPGAIRYDVGERSNLILLPMLQAALEQVLEWTPQAVQDYCRELTREPLARIRELGFWVEDESHRASNLFGIRPPAGLDVEGLRAALGERRVAVSVRGSAVRVSPHVYNDREDLDALTSALEACLAHA